LCFFFFQAEDGIRDRNVTGVQTCALPIWPGFIMPQATQRRAVLESGAARLFFLFQQEKDDRARSKPKEAHHEKAHFPTQFSQSRSEERRVGKECNTRRAPGC